MYFKYSDIITQHDAKICIKDINGFSFKSLLHLVADYQGLI
jgi:hypothetical protein